MKRVPFFLLTLAAIGLACSDSATNPPDDQAGPPATVQVFSGNLQHAQVLSLLPAQLVVEVLDANGRYVSGETVTFTTTSGGSLDPTNAVSNSLGQARSTYTLGPSAGEQAVVAAVGTLSTQFTVYADAGPASQLVLTGGDQQTGIVGSTLAQSVAVRVTDSGNNPIAGATVTFSPSAGAANPPAQATNAAGTAETHWTLGAVAGAHTMLIAISAGPSVVASATALPGPATDVAFTSGLDQVGERGTELPQPIVVQVSDDYGNAVADVAVSFAVTGDGIVTPDHATTDAAGLAAATWTLGSTLGTQTATATVAALTPATVTAEASVALTVLNHVAIDAEFDQAGDRVVTVSADPPALNVIDPVTGATTSVGLDLAPSAVSVQPDGRYAAVGHNGFISYVDLQSLSVLRVYAVTADVIDLVLPGNGWVYAFPRIDQWETIRSINLTTGVESNTGGIYAGTLAKLHPSGDYIYGADNGLSPSDFEKYDIRPGVAVYLYDSPYHGDYAFSGNLWFYDDGTRIIARSGNVFTSSTVQAQDMLYVGSLAGVFAITSAAHSSALQRVVLVGPADFSGVGGTELRSYTASFLAYQGALPLPPYVETGPSGTTAFPSEGRFVFVEQGGTRVFVLLRGADPYVGRFNTGLAVFEAADIP